MRPKVTLSQPGIYRICVQGALDGRWAEYFDEMRIEVRTSPDGSPITILVGCVPDQAALQGVLQKLYNLGFPLISAEHQDAAGDQPNVQ